MEPRDERHRALKTVIAAVVLLPFGCALTAPVVGWPHAFPGLFLQSSEEVRMLAAAACVLGPFGVALVLIWRRG